MFKTFQPLILASESPRRKSLLGSVGVDFDVCPSKIDESTLLNEGAADPAAIAERCAALKAASVSRLHPSAWIYGADTIVVFNGKVFGKPFDAAEAIRILRTLNNRTHEVITGMCLIRPGGKFCRSGAVTTRVRFRDLSAGEIEAYVRTGEPLDKAGAYGIQGIGAFLVRSVDGSYTNVVGLPLCETLDWLLSEKIIGPA